jgi:hypothetical protein
LELVEDHKYGLVSNGEYITVTYIFLDSTLLQKMTLAIREAVIHHRALVAFTETLQAENDRLVGEWEDHVRCWELDPLNVQSPYDIPEESK